MRAQRGKAERRGILTQETPVVPRISDLVYLAASARGKIELTMSEDDGQEDDRGPKTE